MRIWLLLAFATGCSADSKGLSVEICNGVDDDGDGDVDEGFQDADGDGIANCVDDTCDVPLPDATTVETVDACEGVVAAEVDDPWNVETEWSYTDPGGGSIVLPVVGELTDSNGDGAVDDSDTPDIAVTTYSGTLLLLSGADGSVLWELDGYNPYAGVLIADVDADGGNEVVSMTTAGEITAVAGDGTVKWTSEAFTLVQYYPQPVVGDLDEDGLPEIVFDIAVVSGVDGSTLFQLDQPDSLWYTPIVADFDQDGSEEIILGEDVFGADGTLLWSGPTSAWGQFAALAETDGDAGAEILLSPTPARGSTTRTAPSS